MQRALDRRQMILEALSDRRQETVENLAAEFGVSKRTIRYDIEILGCSAPIYTVQGGGGGIRVADGWSRSRCSAAKMKNTHQSAAADTPVSIRSAYC